MGRLIMSPHQDLHCLNRYLILVCMSERLASPHLSNNWVTANEHMPSNMCKMCRFRLSCACAQCIPDRVCSLFIHSVVSNDSFSRQWMVWSECADAHVDLGLCCPHTSMPEDTFPHGAARLSLNSFGAKFQTTYVVCFFFYFNKLSFGKKFICKLERLNVKQRRSRDWAVSSGSMLFAKAYYYCIACGSERVKR